MATALVCVIDATASRANTIYENSAGRSRKCLMDAHVLTFLQNSQHFKSCDFSIHVSELGNPDSYSFGFTFQPTLLHGPFSIYGVKFDATLSH